MMRQSGSFRGALSCAVLNPCQLTFTLHSNRASEYNSTLNKHCMFKILIMTEVG